MSVRRVTLRDDYSLHARTVCECMVCGHKWEDVARYNTHIPECPKCRERADRAQVRAKAGTFRVLNSLTDADHDPDSPPGE